MIGRTARLQLEEVEDVVAEGLQRILDDDLTRELEQELGALENLRLGEMPEEGVVH